MAGRIAVPRFSQRPWAAAAASHGGAGGFAGVGVPYPHSGGCHVGCVEDVAGLHRRPVVARMKCIGATVMQPTPVGAECTVAHKVFVVGQDVCPGVGSSRDPRARGRSSRPAPARCCPSGLNSPCEDAPGRVPVKRSAVGRTSLRIPDPHRVGRFRRPPRWSFHPAATQVRRRDRGSRSKSCGRVRRCRCATTRCRIGC